MVLFLSAGKGYVALQVHQKCALRIAQRSVGQSRIPGFAIAFILYRLFVCPWIASLQYCCRSADILKRKQHSLSINFLHTGYSKNFHCLFPNSFQQSPTGKSPGTGTFPQSFPQAVDCFCGETKKQIDVHILFKAYKFYDNNKKAYKTPFFQGSN